MKIAFFTPSPEQRVGGLDAAIEGLREALRERGIPVCDALADAAGGFSVAHFHGLWQPSHARAANACRTRGIRYVVSPHGMLEPWAWRHKRWKKWPYFHLVEKGHLMRASAVLATAPGEARRLQDFLPGQRVVTLPLGLTGDARPDYDAARQFLGWRSNERVLLFLSRIHVKKGLDLLLKALTTIAVPANVRVVIVGSGEADEVKKLQRFATENAMRLPTIEWKGAIWGEARWPYFQGADLFCLPTHSENFGLAILEACQVGTPSLTTTETPWAEALAGSRGLIGQPTIESIREMLMEFFARPPTSAEQRRDLAEWAWANYDWRALAGKYADFYATLDAPK